MIIDRKWIMVDPTMVRGVGYPPPPITDPWVNNTFINDCRLLQATKYHILSPQLLNARADAYFLISVIDHNLDEEIEFVKRVHREGSKVVIALSLDGRFTGGHGLMCHNTGTLYIDLCREADAIWSGVSEKLHIYGNYQHKVVNAGEFVEPLNLNIPPIDRRNIDMLGTGFNDESSLSLNLVFFLMLKEKYPEKRFVYAFRNSPSYLPMMQQVQSKYPQIEFTQESFPALLDNSKAYINIEPRPRGGRAVLEAWHHRVPSISYSQTYWSKLFPDFAFDDLSFDKMVDLYDRLLASDYNTIIKKSEETMQYDYYEVVYKRLTDKLDEVTNVK
jgi:hypothetical protein